MKGFSSKVSRASLLILLILTTSGSVLGQGGYNDDRVMIQGFIWESHQQGQHKGEGGHEYEVDWQYEWYSHVKDQVSELADAKFDLIWLPPPSQGEGAGYHPHEYYNLCNNYGDEAQHREMINALLKAGIEPVADIVINHRNGTPGWATFKNPDWPARYICCTDEFWSQDPNTMIEEDRQILLKGDKGASDYSGAGSNWDGARDLDHANSCLRGGIKTYLSKLKTFGYRGWRYDMVKGFDPVYIAEYNFASTPTFAVGEYLDGNENTLTWWVDQTKLTGQPDPAERACSAFDFASYYRLKDFINSGKYNHLPAITFHDQIDDGLIAINKNKAVTFLENHDTGFPQKQFDSFGNDQKLMQGYAYILTHPGLPCVYWKHYFDWNRGNEIKKLIKARKYAGVHSGSYIKTEVHGEDYVAVVGDKPVDSSTLIVKIGPGFGFNPDSSVWELETCGQDYAVWVRKSKKMEMKDKVDGPMPAFEIPENP